MKKYFALAAILASSLFMALPAPTARADVSVSFSFFQGSLTPYGHWVTVGSYGRCWYPVGVPAGWQPYTVGHWGYGDYGYTWVSADPWGDVTYRYGSWTFVPPFGWIWVPGYTWAPAWVTWSYSPDYIGWAPIPPSFSFAVGGYFGSPVVVSRSWYCFVPKHNFATYNVAQVRVPVRQNSVILASSRNVTRFPVSNGVVRNTGVPLRNIESVTQTRVQRVSASEMRVAPARVEAIRTSGGTRRVAVAAPATTSAQSRQPAARKERETRNQGASQPSTNVRRAPATRNEVARPSSVSQPKRQSQPRPQQQPETRQKPSREQSQAARPQKSRQSQQSQVQQSRVEPRASAKSASAARERERARAAEVSRSRPAPQPSREMAPASRPQPSKQNQVKSQRSAPSSRAKAEPSRRKPQPEKKPNSSE